MQFNDSTNKTGICQEIDSLCDSDTTSYPLADKARRVNAAYEELIGEIINADGTWQWDDTNLTTLPVGTQNLVASQAAYSFNDKFLQIERVKVLDDGGDWHIVDPIDEVDLEAEGIAIEEYFETTGLPTHYDKVSDDTIKLYPAPDDGVSVTLASGLKIHFKRTADLFTASDTTQEPGLPSTHHILLAYMAAIPYLMIYHPSRVPSLERKIAEMRKTLLAHYAHREKDRRKIIRTKKITYK